MTLAELRALPRPRQRRSLRMADALPLLVRLLSSCRIVAVEDRAQGIVFRLGGETEQGTAFHLTCIVPSAHDEVQLTSAERAVAELLCEGQTLVQIAQQRGVSSNTVKTQVRQILRKFNVDSRVALVRRWCP